MIEGFVHKKNRRQWRQPWVSAPQHLKMKPLSIERLVGLPNAV